MNSLGIRALVLVVLASVCAFLAPAATAGTTGTISGTVTVPGPSPSAPLHTQAQIQVQEGGTWKVVENTYTIAPSGPYASEALAPGTYRVAFSNPDAISQVSAPVTVSADVDTVVDVTLDPGASIKGQFTIPAGGPAVDGFARAFIRTSTGTWQEVDNSLVEPNGRYSIGGLVGGDYKVGFRDLKSNYAQEYYDNVATLDQAAVLAVPAGTETTGINVTLSTEPLPVPQPTPTPTPPPTSTPVPTPLPTSIGFSKPVRLVGKARVGKRIKVDLGKLTPSSARARYKWSLDGTLIRKATRSSLRPTKAMAGHSLSVVVIISAPGYPTVRLRLPAKKVRAR